MKAGTLQRAGLLFCVWPCTLKNNMATEQNDLLLFGEDFDGIVDMSEDEDELQEQFIEAVDEVSTQNFDIT